MLGTAGDNAYGQAGKKVDNRPGRALVSALNQCRLTFHLCGEPIVDKFANAGHDKKFKKLQKSLKKSFKAQELAPYKKPDRPPGDDCLPVCLPLFQNTELYRSPQFIDTWHCLCRHE